MIFALVMAVALLAYANGANDNFKAVATVYGSKTLGYRPALALATVAQVLGSLASVLLAGALVKAFGGKGLVPAVVVGDPTFLVAVGAGAAATVLIATRVGLPVSTTHALVGGLMGGGLAMAPADLAWSRLGSGYFLPLLTSPLMALVGAALLYPVARGLRRRLRVEPTTCVCLDGGVEHADMQPDGSLILRRTGLRVHVEDVGACSQRYEGSIVGVSAQRVVDTLHTASALTLGFARGLNDTPKVCALLVAAGWSGVDPRLALLVVAVVMGLGGVLHARRVAETLSHRITDINHGQGLLANAVSSALVVGASMLGSPVSTTHVSTGAIFGIGLWNGRTDWRLAGGIVLAWVATLPLGASLAWVTARALMA